MKMRIARWSLLLVGMLLLTWLIYLPGLNGNYTFDDYPNIVENIALLRGDADLALGYFNQALQADLRPGAALNQAATLASAGHYELALNHLDLLEQLWDTAQADSFNMPAIHRWVLQKQKYWPREIAHLRQVLKADQDSVAIPTMTQESE